MLANQAPRLNHHRRFLPLSPIHTTGGYEALKPEGLAAAAALIQRCHEQGLGVIVVHGAGSFGHPQAKKYQINKGWAQLPRATEAEQRAAFETVRFGFAATRCSVLKLSNIILSELVGRGYVQELESVNWLAWVRCLSCPPP